MGSGRGRADRCGERSRGLSPHRRRRRRARFLRPSGSESGSRYPSVVFPTGLTALLLPPTIASSELIDAPGSHRFQKYRLRYPSLLQA